MAENAQPKYRLLKKRRTDAFCPPFFLLAYNFVERFNEFVGVDAVNFACALNALTSCRGTAETVHTERHKGLCRFGMSVKNFAYKHRLIYHSVFLLSRETAPKWNFSAAVRDCRLVKFRKTCRRNGLSYTSGRFVGNVELQRFRKFGEVRVKYLVRLVKNNVSALTGSNSSEN